MAQASYTQQEILGQLDRAAEIYTSFLTFDQGQTYPVEVRLSAYQDTRWWAITLEELFFSPRAEGHKGVRLAVYSYGNCLRGKVPALGPCVFTSTSDGPEGPTFVVRPYPNWEHLRRGAKSMCIRGKVVPIGTDPNAYEEAGIHLLDPPRIKGHEVLRGLPLAHRRMLLGTEEELRTKFKVAARPPLILRLDEWYHPRILRDEIPSQSETFRMLAEVLVSGDASRYCPTQLPNTHWSNWPDAGILERPLDE